MVGEIRKFLQWLIVIGIVIFACGVAVSAWDPSIFAVEKPEALRPVNFKIQEELLNQIPLNVATEAITVTVAVADNTPQDFSSNPAVAAMQLLNFFMVGAVDHCVLKVHCAYEIDPGKIRIGEVRVDNDILYIPYDGGLTAVTTDGPETIVFSGNCTHFQGPLNKIIEDKYNEDEIRDLLIQEAVRIAILDYQGLPWETHSSEEQEHLKNRQPAATNARVRALKQYAAITLVALMNPYYEASEGGVIKGVVIETDMRDAMGQRLPIPPIAKAYWTTEELLEELAKMSGN